MIVRSGLCAILLAFLSSVPLRAGAWASPEDERASREMIKYEEDRAEVRKLLDTGTPTAMLSALRLRERAVELRTRAFAQAMLYEHAARFGLDEVERARLRRGLMAVAENKKAPATARDESIRALMASPWDGRDDWYEGLLADATLRAPDDGGSLYSPLGRALETDPDRWVPRLIPKLAHKGVVRSNVAHILAELADRDASNKKPARRDVAVALLPWLADREWAEGVSYTASPRANYITSLDRLDLPEAIPGLIHVVETERDYVGARAAGALEHFHDPRALPALRKALRWHLGVEWERDEFLRAIKVCGGQKSRDAVGALLAYARAAATPDGMEQIRYGDINQRPQDEVLALGIQLAHEPTIDDETVTLVVATLRRMPADPVAFALEAPLFAWSAKAAHRHVIDRIADRDLDDRLLRMTLDGRSALAAAMGSELRVVLARGGIGAGRAAAVLDDRPAVTRLLGSTDVPAILSLLHASEVSDRRGLDPTMDWRVSVRGGRGGSIPLAIADIGPLLARPEAAVASAARAWLTREGGPAAKAWLAGNGVRPNPPPTAARAYNIAGVAPGMKRTAVDGIGKIAADVRYGPQHDVVAVTGRALRDGAKEIVGAGAPAGDVRNLLGRPDREDAGHVFATVGGFFWHYNRAGVVIVFSFVDDRFTLNDAAPSYQVQLIDPATYEAAMSARESHGNRNGNPEHC
jgi:hypothetical protein